MTQVATRRLSRARLRSLALDDANVPLTIVVAPAGYGKSTLLEELNDAWAGEIAVVHGASATVSEDLEAAALTVQSAREQGTALLVTIDDVHLLSGQRPLAALSAVVVSLRASGPVRVVIAGRRLPAIDLQRPRLDGLVRDITANDLRFRSWEVEDLFHRVWRLHLPPGELATLAAATEGWAAGLRFYFCAVDRATEEQRRAELDRLRHNRLSTVRSYLEENVLASLPAPLASFAVDASVLGWLEPRLVNRFLDRIDSADRLEELVERQLFTRRLPDGAYRFHEVFRSTLEGAFAASAPPTERLARYQLAGELLEDRGAIADAVRAYTVAGNDDAVARLVRANVGRLAPIDADGHATIDGIADIPAGLLEDPRLRLARAEWLQRTGRPIAAYRELRGFVDDETSADIRSSVTAARDDLRPWLDSPNQTVEPHSLSSAMRTILAGDRPSLRRLTVDDATLVEALAALLDGDPARAVQCTDRVRSAISFTHRPFAHLASTVCAALGWWLVDGLDPGERLAALRDEADAVRQVWAARLLRALLLAFPLDRDPNVNALAEVLVREAARDDDPWTPLAVEFALLLGAAARTAPDERFAFVAQRCAGTTDRFEEVGAHDLARWTIGFRALLSTARGRHGHGFERLAPTPGELRSLRESRSEIASTVQALLNETRAAAPTSGSVSGSTTASCDDDLQGVAFADDVVVPISSLLTRSAHTGAPGVVSADDAGTHQVAIRCFGDFELCVDSVPLDLTALRPQAMSILRMLAYHAPRVVSGEEVLEAIWPESDPAPASKRLHVAISAIRSALGTAASLLHREQGGYSLARRTALRSDAEQFRDALRLFTRRVPTQPGQGQNSGAEQHEQRIAVARALVALHAGPLLAEENGLDWVFRERDRCARSAGDAAVMLATDHVRNGDDETAAAIASMGLQLYPYSEELWQVLIATQERRGLAADASRTRQTMEKTFAGA